MGHSPTPWRLEETSRDEIIRDAAGNVVHWDTTYYPSGLASEDAEYIVQCVNRVEKLEEALKSVLLIHEGAEFEDAEGMDEIGRIVRAVLEK